jgi:hypothetical protein
MFGIDKTGLSFWNSTMSNAGSDRELWIQARLMCQGFPVQIFLGRTGARLLFLLQRAGMKAVCLAAVVFPCAVTSRGDGPTSVLPDQSVHQEQPCTLYVAPNGSKSNSGKSPTSGVSLLRAAAQAVAGDMVCIEPGTYSLASTFYPSHSGNANAWIVFTRYGAGIVDIVWTAGANASDKTMIHMYNAKFPNGPSYIEFKGLTLDGRNIAENGFFCQGSHHLRYIQNTVINQGSSGIGSVLCDYQTADHNIVYHNGYHGGWSSGISYNSSQWFDKYTGFHNIVSNNIVVGSYDNSSNHTDGNGIIMDLSTRSYNPATANTPPALIVNNVVYGNGGRCIENYVVTNIWVVNNTCYYNGLDLALGNVGNITSNNSSNEYFINNIVETWNREPPFLVTGKVKARLVFRHNLVYGASNSGISDRNPRDFLVANPMFVNPPLFNLTGGGQHALALKPALLGNGLHLQPNSLGIGVGIDPSSLAGGNAALKSDLSTYIYSDIMGNPRPHGGPFNLGAY